jgi:hypothetical protein
VHDKRGGGRERLQSGADDPMADGFRDRLRPEALSILSGGGKGPRLNRVGGRQCCALGADPAVANGVVYLGSRDGNIYAASLAVADAAAPMRVVLHRDRRLMPTN